MKKHLHVIQSIVPGSIAEEMELQPGDTVLASMARISRMCLTIIIWSMMNLLKC